MVPSTLAVGCAMRRSLDTLHIGYGGVERLLAHTRASRTRTEVEKEIILKVDEFSDVLDVAGERLASTRSERSDIPCVCLGDSRQPAYSTCTIYVVATSTGNCS